MESFKALVLCMLIASAGSARAETTNAFTVHSLLEPPGRPDSFMEEVGQAYHFRLMDTVTNGLAPINVVNWEIRYARDPMGEHDSLTGSLKGAAGKSFVHSLRKLALDTPLLSWTKDKPTFLARAVRDSVNGVEEEELSLLGPEDRNARYRTVSTSWWKELDERPLRYGMRPFRTSPYAYVSYAFRDDTGEYVAFANGRYFYKDFADHRVELTASFPIDRKTSFDIGATGEFEPGRRNFHPVLQVRKESGNQSAFVSFTPLTLGVIAGYSRRF